MNDKDMCLFSGVRFDGTLRGLKSALDTFKREAVEMFASQYMLEGESDESPTNDMEFHELKAKHRGHTLSDYIDWASGVSTGDRRSVPPTAKGL
jgi:hypothetical protein